MRNGEEKREEEEGRKERTKLLATAVARRVDVGCR
jgi:hypothetical protein